MGRQTDVILITGFLGSGKTTFLNRLVKGFPEDVRGMILMNEFGEIGIDAHLIETADMDIVEINKGSIFCACVKTDFIRALSKIASSIQPDLLFIEATGAADPTDLKRSLRLEIFRDRYRLRDQFCLIDAENFEALYDTFASVEKQIQSSTVFIINKTDLATSEEISIIREIVEKHHPDPRFIECTYGDIPLTEFVSLESAHPNPLLAEEITGPSAEELESSLNAVLNDPRAALFPPDLLLSTIYHWKGDSLDEFKGLVKHFPSGLVRAKGFLMQEGSRYLFNWTMGRWTVESVTDGPSSTVPINQLAFIAPPDIMAQLETLAQEQPDRFTANAPGLQPT